MARHSRTTAVPAILLVLLFIPSIVFAQDSALSRTVASTHGQSRQRDPELAAIFQAEREGRLVDAKELLNAAIGKAESGPGSERRLSLLLNHLANVEFLQGHSDDAIATAERALALDKKSFGPQSPAVARDLNNLAVFRRASGKPGGDSQIEREYKQELAVARQNRERRPDILLGAIYDLASYYLEHKRPADAEPLLNEALRMCREGGGSRTIRCSTYRILLAQAYRQSGHANAAEQMTFDAAAASPSRPWRAKLMNLEALAQQYEEDGTYDLAETSYRKVIALIQANTKPEEPSELPFVMERLGNVLVKEGRNVEAEDLFKRALEMEEQAALRKPPPVPPSFNLYGLMNLYRSEGRLADIEPILQRVAEVQEKVSGPRSKPLAQTLLSLTRVYSEEGKYSDAEPLCRRALKIQEAGYGAESQRLIPALDTCAKVMRRVGDASEAKTLAARANALRSKHAAP